MCTGKNGHEILLTGESTMRKKRYSAEFKKEAARLMIIEGLSASEVSEKLGVNSNLLYRWKSEHLEELEGDKGCKENASPKEMAEEIARLRKQLAKSERINEILKKTVDYFAKDES
jgi:transposase